jgi:hypothetical protein
MEAVSTNLTILNRVLETSFRILTEKHRKFSLFYTVASR